MKVYYCEHCKKMVLVLEDSSCTPMCCGVPMKELTANTVDAAKEKHVPAYELRGNEIFAKVGEVAHPMMEAHHIDFIALETNKGIHVVYLEVNKPAEALFALPEGEKALAIYEHCNLHGLWKVEL